MTVTRMDNVGIVVENHPAPRLLGGSSPLALHLLATIDNVWDVAMRVDGFGAGATEVSRVSTQMLAAPNGWWAPRDDDGIEDRYEHRDVIHVGCGHDERQRDATTVHQQVTLAPLFFPDRSGWARPLLAPREP